MKRFLISIAILLAALTPLAQARAEAVCACYFGENDDCAYDLDDGFKFPSSSTQCLTWCIDPIEEGGAGHPDTTLEDWAGESTDVEGAQVIADCEEAIEDAEEMADAAAASTSSSAGTTATRPLITPQLQIEIPDLTFTTPTSSSGTVTSNFIGEYVAAIYKYLIGFGATVAIVMIMVGGIQYVVGATMGDIGKAKARITNAVTGLVLLLFTVVILFTVNPQLTIFNPLKTTYIDPVSFLTDNYDYSGGVTLDDISSLAGVYCPKSGGSAAVDDIAVSFKGKVTYRMGGKGGKPPFQWETKSDPSTGQPYKEFCPAGTMCLDCSGFADVIRACAGLPVAGHSTAKLFPSATKITSCTSTTVNGTTLQPGDRLGWSPPKEGSYGHVYTYVGNGMVADSHGSGRPAGTAYGYYSVDSFICAQLDKHVFKILPVE